MADNSNIIKIWGLRQRILLTRDSEIDLITVKKDCFCSTHRHDKKINKFWVVSGQLAVETSHGPVILGPGECLEVRPPMTHRFRALKDSVVIEAAYVETGEIDAKDINRFSQGGQIIEGKEITLDDMKEQGLLDKIKD